MKKIAAINIALFIVLSMIISAIASPGEISEVYINPDNQVVEIGNYIEVEIYANLTDPVSGWELETLHFNPDVLYLNSIKEGDLLNSVGTTYYENGTIDNNTGEAMDFFCFTLGDSNSDEGSLCILNFTTKNAGVSTIEFETILSFEGASVQHTNQSGTITVIEIQPPEIVDNSLSVAYTENPYEFNANVIDSDGVLEARVEYTYGDIVINISMINLEGNIWAYTIPNVPSSYDNIQYAISARDNNDNWNSTSTKNIPIIDDDAPEITSVEISDLKQYVGDNLRITVTAIDNRNIAEIRVNITDPDSITNSTSILASKVGDDYYLEQVFQSIGVYSFIVFVEDDAGNNVESITYNFYIYPQYDLDKSGEINILDITSVTFHYGEEGEPRWIIQDISLPLDGVININDVTRVTGHYGENYPELIDI